MTYLTSYTYPNLNHRTNLLSPLIFCPLPAPPSPVIRWLIYLLFQHPVKSIVEMVKLPMFRGYITLSRHTVLQTAVLPHVAYCRLDTRWSLDPGPTLDPAGKHGWLQEVFKWKTSYDSGTISWHTVLICESNSFSPTGEKIITTTVN